VQRAVIFPTTNISLSVPCPLSDDVVYIQYNGSFLHKTIRCIFHSDAIFGDEAVSMMMYEYVDDITPCFINEVYICHITLFSYTYIIADATMTFNLSVKRRLTVQHVNIHPFYGNRYHRKESEAWCYSLLDRLST